MSTTCGRRVSEAAVKLLEAVCCAVLRSGGWRVANDLLPCLDTIIHTLTAAMHTVHAAEHASEAEAALKKVVVDNPFIAEPHALLAQVRYTL